MADNNEGHGMQPGQPVKLNERRTDRGLPDIADDSELQGFNWAQVNVGGGTEKSEKPAPVTATIDQRNSNNRNDLVPWFVLLAAAVVVVAMVAAAALALAIRGEQTRERDMDLVARAVKAETEAELAPAISKLQTDMVRALQDSAQAKDWTDQKNTELKTLRKAYDR